MESFCMESTERSDERRTASELGGVDAARENLLRLRLEAERRRRQASRVIRPRGKWDAAIPLSYAQEGLWYLEQVGLVGPAYNMPLVLRLSGNLDENALERSFAEIVRRHEVLRTRFGIEHGVPQQIIDSPGHFILRREDFTRAANAESL